jgi:hypothetical protein
MSNEKNGKGGNIINLGPAITTALPGNLTIQAGAGPGTHAVGDILFCTGDHTKPILKLCGDGTVEVRGEKVVFPQDVARGLREWFANCEAVPS